MATPTPPCNGRIKKLPPLLINQLAAGEIVTRPASVVKELLENAIDAGATQIEIKITQGGMGMIEVSDNGCGIHPDDMVMAVTRHATSKIADVANLQGIRTLGFRGEALASTAAVSRLTLSSSHDDSGIGRQLHVAGILEDTPILAPIVHGQGTTVLVKDLYFNVPARRGNLKSVATEFAHIEAVVREVALVYADVSLSLYHDQKKRLDLPATSLQYSGDGSSELDILSVEGRGERLPLGRLEQALAISLESQSVPIFVDLEALLGSQFEQLPSLPESQGSNGYEVTAPPLLDDLEALEGGAQVGAEPTKSTLLETMPHIEGWLWVSQQANEALPKLLYVNGRLIKDPLIASQIRQALQTVNITNAGYALYFQLPSHWLNLNVHPSKQKIKIHALANIMAHLNYAIKAKLGVFSAQFRTPSKHSTQTKLKAAGDQRYINEPSQSYQTSSAQVSSDLSLTSGHTASLGSSSPTDLNCQADTEATLDTEREASADHRCEFQESVSNSLVDTAERPVLLNVIDDIALLQKLRGSVNNVAKLTTELPPKVSEAKLATDSKTPISEKLPLWLIYWHDQHFLIEWEQLRGFLSLQSTERELIHSGLQVSQLDHEGNNVASEGQQADSVKHYQVYLDSYFLKHGSAPWLYEALYQHSVAVVDLTQLLQLMLSNISHQHGVDE